jgi:hypothetical protein
VITVKLFHFILRTENSLVSRKKKDLIDDELIHQFSGMEVSHHERVPLLSHEE